MQNLCQQFRLQVHKTNRGTRGPSKLTPSDHNILKWNIIFETTKRAKETFILNKKLAKEITKLSIKDERVEDAYTIAQLSLETKTKKEASIHQIREKDILKQPTPKYSIISSRR